MGVCLTQNMLGGEVSAPHCYSVYVTGYIGPLDMDIKDICIRYTQHQTSLAAEESSRVSLKKKNQNLLYLVLIKGL